MKRVLSDRDDDAGHYGAHMTLAQLMRRYWWPSMAQDAAEYVKTCEVCQKYALNTPAASVESWLILEPFELITWDFLGSLTPVGDLGYLLVVVDYATRWCEVSLVPSADHHQVMLMLSAIYARYGTPRICLSDRSPAFKDQHSRAMA